MTDLKGASFGDDPHLAGCAADVVHSSAVKLMKALQRLSQSAAFQ